MLKTRIIADDRRHDAEDPAVASSKVASNSASDDVAPLQLRARGRCGWRSPTLALLCKCGAALLGRDARLDLLRLALLLRLLLQSYFVNVLQLLKLLSVILDDEVITFCSSLSQVSRAKSCMLCRRIAYGHELWVLRPLLLSSS